MTCFLIALLFSSSSIYAVDLFGNEELAEGEISMADQKDLYDQFFGKIVDITRSPFNKAERSDFDANNLVGKSIECFHARPADRRGLRCRRSGVRDHPSAPVRLPSKGLLTRSRPARSPEAHCSVTGCE